MKRGGEDTQVEGRRHTKGADTALDALEGGRRPGGGSG